MKNLAFPKLFGEIEKKHILQQQQLKMYHQILYKRKKKTLCYFVHRKNKTASKKIVYSMEKLAVKAVNESKDGIGKIRLHQKNFLEEKKIVYSMEKLAVEAVN